MQNSRQFRGRPSAALVISVVALVFALTGGAYAVGIGKGSVSTKSLKNGAVNTKKLKNGAVSRAKLSADQKTLWALVSFDGSIIKQSGGISLTGSVNPGGRFFDFGADLSGRAIVVSEADPDGTGEVTAALCGPAPQGVDCTQAPDDNRHVFVGTSNSAGAPATGRFYLAVLPK